MRYFPAFFDIADKPVLIVGGGELALRKARLLAKAGPKLKLLAEKFSDHLVAELGSKAAFRSGRFTDADLDEGFALVVAATDSDLDEEVALAAKARRIPVNVVDRPRLCDFVVPSLVERGHLTIGISTGGAAPVLGRTIRAKIEAMLPRRLGDLVDFAAGYRAAVAANVPAPGRRSFWERFFASPVAEKVLSGKVAVAREEMLRLINQPAAAPEGPAAAPQGHVAIVGAGPGDPELLTLKALRFCQEADVILYDNLVGDGVLDLCRRDATRIYVGKRKADHAVPQQDIAARMISLAREGQRVVRLKGGDPFVFGRGGEELEAVRAAGVNCTVVPGITAATGCGAISGIPLTHRDHAQAVTFVTGHAKAGGIPDLDWPALAKPNQTVVIYMGVGTAPTIAARLLTEGLAPTTPAAIIEKGTCEDERVIISDLADLPDAISRDDVTGPAIVIIGSVVTLAPAAAQAAPKAVAHG